jgi:hypothetical protein
MNRWSIALMLGMLPLAGCVHAASPASVETGSADVASDQERGAEIQFEPADLHIALRIKGAKDGELRDGDVVRSGDRIQLTIQTKVDSLVYLAYCSTRGGLAWFPERGGLMAKANAPLIAPGEHGAIVMDDQIGLETLYVVVTQRELSVADHELANAIEASKAGGGANDCETPFDGQTGRSPVRKPERIHDKTPAPRDSSTAASRANIGGAQAGGADLTAATERPEPDVGMVRGGYIAWDDLRQVNAKVDPSGIAILRYTFRHVAPSP